MDLFVLVDAGSIEQLTADGYRSLVVEVSMGNGGTMDFGFEEMQTV
jgi:hypothetical protein